MHVTDEGVSVEALIAAIKSSIRKAGVSSNSDMESLRVASVQLILRTVACRRVGGALDFRIPYLGMKLVVGSRITRHDTHTVDLTLVPPFQQKASEVPVEVAEVLVDAITTICKTMTSAAGGDDPWFFSKGTVDLTFAISQTGEIYLATDGLLSNEVTHTLRLELVPSSV